MVSEAASGDRDDSRGGAAAFAQHGHTHGGLFSLEGTGTPPLPADRAMKPIVAGSRKIPIEVDADKFERLAADFGLFNPDFLKSLERAEHDPRAGRIRKLASLHDLRCK